MSLLYYRSSSDIITVSVTISYSLSFDSFALAQDIRKSEARLLTKIL